MAKIGILSRGKIDYIVILLIVLVSDACYWFETSGDEVFSFVRFAFLFIFPFFLIAKYHPTFKKNGLVIVGIMSAVIILSALINNGRIKGGDITLIFTLLSANLVAYSFDKEYFFFLYRNTVFGITCYSLFIWIIVALGLVSPHSVINIASAHLKSFGGCIFNGEGLLTRNSAFFREAGVFSFFLCSAFMLECTQVKKLSRKRLLIYVVGIISTFSTGGILVFSLLIVSKILLEKSSSNFFFGTFLIIAIIIAFVFVPDIQELIFGKLSDEDNVSRIARLSSFSIPFNMIMQNPLFGCGLDSFAATYARQGGILAFTVGIGSATNTILNASAVWGVGMAFFFLLSYWRFSKILSSVILKRTIFFLCFLALLSNEDLRFTMMAYIFPFIAIVQHQKITH